MDDNCEGLSLSASPLPPFPVSYGKRALLPPLGRGQDAGVWKVLDEGIRLGLDLSFVWHWPRPSVRTWASGHPPATYENPVSSATPDGLRF